MERGEQSEDEAVIGKEGAGLLFSQGRGVVLDVKALTELQLHTGPP